MQQAAAPWNTTNGKFNRFSQTAMVTPAISGIRNKDALQVRHSSWNSSGNPEMPPAMLPQCGAQASLQLLKLLARAQPRT